MSRFPSVAVYFVFFCSGAASLICEVVWFKQLQLVLGSSTVAMGVVVAAFFTGLALGSWRYGLRADRWRYLLRNYAILELSLGGLSALVTLLLSRWEGWVGPLMAWMGVGSSGAVSVMIVLSVGVLIPPTVLMGATLPVLAKYIVRRHSHLAHKIGILYALNTLGAATGCFVVGFVLIGFLGVIQSALVASAIYALIGLSVALVALRVDKEPEIQEDVPTLAEVSTESLPGARSLVIVFAMMGFASIAYEVLWFRILTCFSIHSVYAFSAMLSTYLLGLVIGALICAKYLAPRKDRLLVYFARIQLLIPIAAIVSMVLLGRSRNILYAFGNFEKWIGIDVLLSNIFSGVSGFVFLSLLVLLVPTTIIGIAFPLAAELTVSRLSFLGSRVGILYGLNTLGGVLGSLLTVFVLLPVLGSQGSFVAIVMLNILLFFVTVATQPALRRQLPLLREGAVTAVALAGITLFIGSDFLRRAQTGFEDAEVLAFRETKDATLVVLEYESSITRPFQQLIVNGKSFANNSPPGRRYMGTLGHLPMLLHPKPESALVIAIGTGTTVGSLTLHPELERLTAVDLSKDVFELATHFRPGNHDFMNSPKVQTVVADGRHFLLCTDQRFDVMTFEPPPPHDAGVVNLYSRDFYRLAKRRLAEGGILCQWCPLDVPREKASLMLVKALMDEFPHVSLWIPNRCEGVAIASMQPLAIDFDDLRRRMSHPLLRADLQAYGLAEPEQLLATFLAADDDLARFVGDAPTITDNHPRIEYFNLFPPHLMSYDEIVPFRRPIAPWLIAAQPDPERLELAVDVVTDIWYAHELKRQGRFDDARDRLLRALERDRGNRYLEYLLAALEPRTGLQVAGLP